MIRFILSAVAALTFTLPAQAVDIKEVTSPGGLKAWLVEEPSIPFMALEIRFKGGASVDREGKRGAINMMTALIEEGAGDLDSSEFAAARQELAASYGFDVHDDALSVSARFLSENRDEALALLKLALTEPTFEESAIERVRGQILSIISSDLKDPSKIASAAFDEIAFGDHPYATHLNGTGDSVAALTRDDLLNAYKDAIALDRIFIGAVGDITAEELGVMLDDLLGELPASGAELPEEVDYNLDSGVTVIPFDTPQSIALFGHNGIERDDPEFFPAYILNQVLGDGGLTSRLMKEVREKRGLTYGIYSYLATKDLSELYMGQVASANDRVAQAIDVIRDEWRKAADDGITQEELDVAKTYLTGAYPLRFDGNATIARILVGMQMDDLPISYIETRNAKVEAVTLEEVNALAKRLLQPDALHFVVVGQPEGLEASN